MRREKKVSICMMIKNEEENLHRCLKSLLPIIDSGLGELIIVDTGSRDSSIEIAKEYTNLVYEHKWTNNFSEMRNISISYAKGEWIWIIDADEEIENPKEMISFFKRDLSKYNTISIEMKNYMETAKDGKDPSYNISILNRGFRNSEEFHFRGAIHNQPKYEKPIIFSNIKFGHYGYIWEDEEFKQKKFKRTAGILKQELEKDPRNIYYQYQLGVSTFIVDNEGGLIELKKAYKLIEKLQYKERVKYLYVYGMYSRALFIMKEYDEAIKIAREGLKFSKDYIDLWYILSLSYANTYKNEEAIECGKEFIKCKDRFNRTRISKDPAFTFYYLDDTSKNIIHFTLANRYIFNEDINMALKEVNEMTLSLVKTNIIFEIIKKTKDKKYLIEYIEKVFLEADLKKHFIDKLENYFLEKDSIVLVKEILDFYEEKNIEEDDYYYLNLLRSSIEEKTKLNNEDLDKLLNLDYSEVPAFYGDILTYIVPNELDIETFKNIGKVEDIVKLTIYATNKNKDFHKELSNYLLKKNEIEDLFDFKYWMGLAKPILLREELESEEYIKMFEEYLNKGIIYIQNIYQPNVLKEENIYDLVSDEHRFFFYMSKAKSVEEKDEAQYIRYLRKALKNLPMKKGIEILLDRLQEENQIIEDEMEILKSQFKDNIKVLISANKIEEAEGLIQEYEKMLPKDVEILLFKSEISMLRLGKTNNKKL